MRSDRWINVEGQWAALQHTAENIQGVAELVIVSKHGGLRVARFVSDDGKRTATISYRPGRDTFRVRLNGDLGCMRARARELNFHAKDPRRAFALALAHIEVSTGAVYDMLSAERTAVIARRLTSKRPCRGCGQRVLLKIDARDGIRFCEICREPDAIEERLRGGAVVGVEVLR